MTDGTLVVGASQAGVQVAACLRELGDERPITLVGAERHAPYQRPPLSKELLAGQQEPAALALRTPAYYDQARVDLVLGDAVVDVAADAAGVGTATLASGRRLRFDRLALTVGAAPRRLDLPGADLTGICYLRELDEALTLRALLADAEQVVVIGGGFIGLEAASVARAQGRDVTVVEALDRLVPRAVAPVVSEFYRQAHERRGTRVLLSSAVAGLSGADGRVTGVVLADGTELPADLVLVGIGVVPRTELAAALGLECAGGVVVDRRARTSNPAVVAAGDCTVQPNPLSGTGLVRLESVQNAIAQAAAAAAALLGQPAPPAAVPWFWSNQGDLRLQIAGLSIGYDRHVVRGEPDGERFSVLYYRGEQLLAVDAINAPADYMVVRKALSLGVSLPIEQAADAGVALKSLLPAAR